ncbi:unnamed protein product [Adineta steineri]|uniref:Uncharacterized protein n=1 Tax=Adineta steineri TaxID=433720 RepID=A0A813QKK2_9BILA|nr:unnamed protein product [Adineta steineri]
MLTPENIQKHTLSTNSYPGTAQGGHPFETIPSYMAPEIQHTTAIPSVFPLNGVKHSIIVPPSSAAPVFHGKKSENPAQFLIRVQDYAESVHTWNHTTLLNDIA